MSDVVGDWIVELKFVRGAARHALSLSQEGEHLQGRYRSLYGERELRGRVQGDQVHMQVGIHYQGVGATYSFRGRVQGDTMKGEMGLGEYWQGSWEARRQS